MKNHKNSKNIFKISLLLIGISIIFSFGINATVAANTSNMYVNSSSGSDTYNGLNSTWIGGLNGPKATIKNATGTVKSDGTVHIASGTYKENNITINKNMNIIGENQKNTIINGQQSGNSIFTIASGVNLTIINLTLTNGTSNNGGGAINNIYGGTLTVDNCSFTNNKATGSGGGAIFIIGNSTINNSSFTKNTAINTYGGAIFLIGNSTIKNCNFTSNTAFYYGGAIFNYANDAILTVDSCSFTNNTATYQTGGGGAICNIGTLTIDNSTFTSNNATEGGAICNIGTLTIDISTFISNNATDGGAIFNVDGIGTVIVNFNRIIGNTASNGSAICNLDTTRTVDATDNWWGSNTSPSDMLFGLVSYDPWIVLTITKSHETINVGGTSTITADLLHDSNGVYHNPANGNVPDGIIINFSNNAYGDVNPVSAITTNGIATTTYTGSDQGASNISATVDEQTLKTNITINKAPVNPIPDLNVNPINKTQNANHTALNAATTSIPMQHTGVPVAGLILAILTVIGGSIIPKIKK